MTPASLNARARYGALSRLLAEIQTVGAEPDLVERVLLGIRAIFEPVDRIGFFLADDARGDLVPAGRSPDTRELLAELFSVLPAPKRGRRSMVYIAAPNVFFTATGALLSTPLIEGTTLLGLLVVERKEASGDFGIEDLDWLTNIASQCVAILSRLRRRHMSRDMELAKQIQRGFLQLPSELNGLKIDAQYKPARNLGGDFYDLVPTDGGQVLAVIGDVSGKGVAAALHMGRINMEFKRLAKDVTSPRALLTELNRSVCELSSDDMFITAVCLRLDAHGRRLTVANAGHVLPVVRRASGAVMTLGSAAGLPLGMMANETYVDQTFDLERGDIVLLMTDGVVEALSNDDLLDMRTLIDIVSLAPHDAAKINERILRAVESVIKDGHHDDDIALLTLEVVGEERRPASRRTA
jgi:hypothetical protein